MACTIKANLSNRALEYNRSTTLFIYKVTDIYLIYKHPKSHLPLIMDHHGDGAVNYVHTGIK